MKDLLRGVVNGALRSLGYEVRRIEPLRVNPKYYLRLIDEYFGHLSQTGFLDLPDVPNRTEQLARLDGTAITEAAYVLKYLHLSLVRDGDVCEFGVGTGATSALVANEIAGTGKHLWLFDSFEGLPKPTEKDTLVDDIHSVGSIEAYEGRMSYPMRMVRSRLSRIAFPTNRLHIVPGFIEETIKKAELPRTVAFAYVDFDFYEPIKIALEFLDTVMPADAHIVVDDYGHFSSGAQTAVDEFVNAGAGRYECLLPPRYAGAFAVLHKRA
ncbi:MAG TPA: TylF/MycF/NovP-related O-methyltransferase [Candidatus Hydrogenedentes bacterium]|nr:TylF/MycF/NovP-related O-methyltransferase [Candidatus Hydrogenedentota bacterium]HPG65580.1 TylF/MycF/NovP-related O-methyltransferase [Candidatus Hydrogenedentota bacterium]